MFQFSLFFDITPKRPSKDPSTENYSESLSAVLRLSECILTSHVFRLFS